MALRRLGVYGENLPTKKAKAVVESDFLVAGLIGKFERAYDKAFVVRSPEEAQEIFGLQNNSGYYGWDAVNGFFANAVGVAASLYMAALVGYTGSAIDAVNATQDLDDQQAVAEKILRIKAAYLENLEYGISGNRTGVTIELGDRFLTAANGAGLSTDTFALLDSVAGIRVGDIVKFVATGGGGATVYKKILTVDESLGRVTFTGAFHATANLADNDVVSVPGFRVRTWRKSTTGIVSEVDATLGALFCTTESEVSEFYVYNVFKASKWIEVAVLTTAATLDKKFPKAQSTPSYPTNGAAGTTPTTAAHWSRTLTRFDNLPVRMLANCESTDATIQKAMETYSKARWDNPKVIFNVAENRTKAQLVAIGNGFQRSDDVLGVVVANWLKVTDPFNSAPNAPDRTIPNVGHVMGAWVRSIGTRGIHYIPATKDNPIYGVNGVVGDQFLSDYDRTDLANAGVNVIQEIAGSGIVVRNFFTPSTAVDFMFANGLLMREFIKVSAVTSLQGSENTPNSLERVKEDRMAILNFLYRLWQVGSTGAAPTGETFGQSFDAAGNPTKADDHFEVRADVVNNPAIKISAGERNLDIYFTYPAPAGSIRIGAGILLRG